VESSRESDGETGAGEWACVHGGPHLQVYAIGVGVVTSKSGRHQQE
jgi:hypothetical protein